jgi:uncharacterized protein YkwD
MFRTARPLALRLVVTAVVGSSCASTAPITQPSTPPSTTATTEPAPKPALLASPSAEPAKEREARPPAEPAKAAAPETPPAPPAPASSTSKEPPLKPAGRGAFAYADAASKKDRVAVPKDRLRVGILKDMSALAKRQKRPRPKGDARLDAAMNDLAHNLRGDDLPANDVVDFLIGHYGIAEPSPTLVLSRATAGADREIRQEVLKQVDAVYKTSPVTRVGVGVDRSGDLMYAVVGLQESHVALARVPRRLPSRGATQISATLNGRYREARVVVTTPDGRVTEQTPSTRKGRVGGTLACTADGKYQVEVTAEDAKGTTVLANFPVYCGVDPPAVAPRGAGTHLGRITAESAEKEILALVNRDRATAGLVALVSDERLAEIARAHSRDMADHDFVAHVSPRTGTFLDRVHKGGLTPEVVLENVGRAYSAQDAETGFMSSPGHRANVVEPRATRIGIGVVLGAPVTGTNPLYVTQIFTN